MHNGQCARDSRHHPHLNPLRALGLVVLYMCGSHVVLHTYGSHGRWTSSVGGGLGCIPGHFPVARLLGEWPQLTRQDSVDAGYASCGHSRSMLQLRAVSCQHTGWQLQLYEIEHETSPTPCITLCCMYIVYIATYTLRTRYGTYRQYCGDPGTLRLTLHINNTPTTRIGYLRQLEIVTYCIYALRPCKNPN